MNRKCLNFVNWPWQMMAGSGRVDNQIFYYKTTPMLNSSLLCILVSLGCFCSWNQNSSAFMVNIHSYKAWVLPINCYISWPLRLLSVARHYPTPSMVSDTRVMTILTYHNQLDLMVQQQFETATDWGPDLFLIASLLPRPSEFRTLTHNQTRSQTSSLKSQHMWP